MLEHNIHGLWDELADFGAARSDEALLRLLEALCRLVDAQNANWVGAVRLSNILPADPVNGWRPRVIRYLLPSLPVDASVNAQVKLLEQGCVDETTVRNVALAGSFRANRLADLVEKEWFDSAYYQVYYRGVGHHDAIWVGIPVSEDAECYFGFFRDGVHPPFSAEERDALAYALRGLKWFHRQTLLSHGISAATAPLLPSERKVLSLLLTEMSEKAIAEQLGLAVTTTHQYITAIYRKFGVRGRAGLASLWLGRAD